MQVIFPGLEFLSTLTLVFFFIQTNMATSLLVAIVLNEDVICIKSICTERAVHFLDVTGSENPNVMRFIHETKPVIYEMNHDQETFDPGNKKKQKTIGKHGEKRDRYRTVYIII